MIIQNSNELLRRLMENILSPSNTERTFSYEPKILEFALEILSYLTIYPTYHFTKPRMSKDDLPFL